MSDHLEFRGGAAVGEQLAIDVPQQPPSVARAVACPLCGAATGEPCVTPSGETAASTHRARRRAAAYKPIGGGS